MNSFKCPLFALLFSNLSFVIFSDMGILRLCCSFFGVCCNDGDFFRQIQKFRRLLRRVHCSPWKNISSQSIFINLEILCFVVTLWVVVCGLYTFLFVGLVGIFWKRSNQSSSSATFLIMEQFKVSTTTLASTSDTPKRSRTDIFSVFGVERISLSLVLHVVCMVIMLVLPVLVLLVLGLVMKTKTTATLSRLLSSSYSTSTVTTSPTPSQPDTFRYRHIKTDSDYHYYMRHFGYYLRHFGYDLDTVTTS
ncbi:hypothetical protein MKW98_013781 [Papaver atlanticum]|uniref:Uncharacterized protein n=1 Tax=Papaver atlanticum TaxID=357466 RepID=A0AAD4TDF9_9MAGN|nr:hypothetical protein MKW98_013781 [Papaver atlanticum]